MLYITNDFSLNHITNDQGIKFDQNIRIKRLDPFMVKKVASFLLLKHQKYKSLVTTKKAAKDFSKVLNFKLEKFESKYFSIEDFIRVKPNYEILAGIHNKTDYNWYLITVGE